MDFYDETLKNLQKCKDDLYHDKITVLDALEEVKSLYVLLELKPDWIYSLKEFDLSDNITTENIKTQILECFDDIQNRLIIQQTPLDVHITAKIDPKGLNFHIKARYDLDEKYLEHPIYLELLRLSDMIKHNRRSNK